MQLKNSKTKGTRRSHKSFYPGSLFHKSYVQSFAHQRKDFHYTNKVYKPKHTQDPILNPTRWSFTPCVAPHHTRCTILMQM